LMITFLAKRTNVN